MMRTFDYRLQQKLEEVFMVEPNNLGPSYITALYHRLTGFLKTMPFIFIIPISFISAIFLYFIFGPLLVKLVSLLQYGF